MLKLNFCSKWLFEYKKVRLLISINQVIHSNLSTLSLQKFQCNFFYNINNFSISSTAIGCLSCFFTPISTSATIIASLVIRWWPCAVMTPEKGRHALSKINTAVSMKIAIEDSKSYRRREAEDSQPEGRN